MEITVCDRTVRSVPELIHALLDSPERFFRRGGYELLIDCRKETPLCAFLCDLGYQRIVKDVCTQASRARSEGDKFTEMMSMLEIIAGARTEEETLVRNFYRDFGPVGVLRYVQRLVRNPKEVYHPLNADGRKLLETVANCQPTDAQTVLELRRNYLNLENYVRSMRTFLEDNPFDITAGTYGDGDILCVNLKGCFAFWIYGTAAPLGFESWISSNGGGGA